METNQINQDKPMTPEELEAEERRERKDGIERQIRMETTLDALAKAVMGNGQPGLVQDVACLKRAVQDHDNILLAMQLKKQPEINVAVSHDEEKKNGWGWIMDNWKPITTIIGIIATVAGGKFLIAWDKIFKYIGG